MDHNKRISVNNSDKSVRCYKEGYFKPIVFTLISFLVLAVTFVVLACTLQIYDGDLCSNITSVPLGELRHCVPPWGTLGGGFFRGYGSVTSYEYEAMEHNRTMREVREYSFNVKDVVLSHSSSVYSIPSSVDYFEYKCEASDPVHVGLLDIPQYNRFLHHGYEDNNTGFLDKNVVSCNRSVRLSSRFYLVVYNPNSHSIKLAKEVVMSGTFTVPNKYTAASICHGRCKYWSVLISDFLLENTGDQQDAEVTFLLSPYLRSDLIPMFVILPLGIIGTFLVALFLISRMMDAKSREEEEEERRLLFSKQKVSYSETTPGGSYPIVYINNSAEEAPPSYAAGMQPDSAKLDLYGIPTTI